MFSVQLPEGNIATLKVIKLCVYSAMFVYQNRIYRVEKSGEHGEHAPGTLKVSQGTHKARNYPKDVWIKLKAIYSVKIDQCIYIYLYFTSLA